MILCRAADGDIQKIHWLNQNMDYPEIIKWLGIKKYLNQKDLDALDD